MIIVNSSSTSISKDENVNISERSSSILNIVNELNDQNALTSSDRISSGIYKWYLLISIVFYFYHIS